MAKVLPTLTIQSDAIAAELQTRITTKYGYPDTAAGFKQAVIACFQQVVIEGRNADALKASQAALLSSQTDPTTLVIS